MKTLRIDNIWNFPLSNCTLCQLKSYISKGIQPIFENFASARRGWGWAFGWKVSDAQVFYFCNSKVKTLRMDNVWYFPLSTCTMCPEKSYISKGILPIFENFALAGRCWGWAFGCKVSDAVVFLLLQWQGENFAHRQYLKFPTFSLLSVPAKILYLQSYWTDFRKLYFSSKMLRVAFGGNFRSAHILLLQWQGKTLRIDNIWNFPLSSCTVMAKILYLRRWSTNFRKLCYCSKILRVGIWVEGFRCAAILLLQWQGENFANRKHLKFNHFQHVECPS